MKIVKRVFVVLFSVILIFTLLFVFVFFGSVKCNIYEDRVRIHLVSRSPLSSGTNTWYGRLHEETFYFKDIKSIKLLDKPNYQDDWYPEDGLINTEVGSSGYCDEYPDGFRYMIQSNRSQVILVETNKGGLFMFSTYWPTNMDNTYNELLKAYNAYTKG